MIRWRRILVGIVFVGSVVYAWTRHASAPTSAAPPVLPTGAQYRELGWTAVDWLREGYVEMVSPIRPPSSEDGRIRIVVYVRLPLGSRIRTVKHGDSETTLELPVGTRTDRVEFYGDGQGDAEPSAAWRVLDVRGISFDPSGQQLRVLRPKAVDGRELLGIEWPRGEQQGPATAALGELVLRGLIAGPRQPEARERAAEHLRGLNDCPSCHVPGHPGRRAEHDPGVVNRGTDGSGLFQVASIFRDRLPLEGYRPRDLNKGDPFITRFCGNSRADDSTLRCPDGSILEGELDVRGALKSGDRHAQRLCRSRRALGKSLDESGLMVFREAIAECDIGLP